MGHDDVASGYLISIGFRRLTNCQQDPRDRSVTTSTTKPREILTIISLMYQFFYLGTFYSC